MATVTGYTSAREQAIEDGTVVSGTVNGSGHLILTKHDTSTVDAGYVVGPQGATGATGSAGTNGTNGTNGAGFTSGMLMPFAGDVAAIPSGFLLCDGASVLRSTYAALFTAIGTLYGSVDGTHFNLPNLVGAFPRGVASSPGGTGGAATHSHPLSDAGQAAIIAVTATPSLIERRVTSASWSATHAEGTSQAAANSSSNATGAALTGSTDAASSLPPYLNILYLIKT